jgi:hypothetical protein
VTYSTYSKKMWAIITVSVASVVFAAVLLYMNAVEANGVELSNGQTIRLGQSIDSVIARADGNVLRITEDTYRYPADPQEPAEMTIYTTGNHVSALLVSRGAGNKQASKGVHIGMSEQELKKITGRRLEAINGHEDLVKQKGYKVSGAGSVSYYITASCVKVDNDSITAFAVSRVDAVSKMAFLTRGRICKVPDASPDAGSDQNNR